MELFRRSLKLLQTKINTLNKIITNFFHRLQRKYLINYSIKELKEFVVRLFSNIHTRQFKLFTRIHVYSFNLGTVSKVY